MMWHWADSPSWATMVVRSGTGVYWASDRQRALIGDEERTFRKNNRLHVIKQWEVVETRDGNDFRRNVDRKTVVRNAPPGATHGQVYNTVAYFKMCNGKRHVWNGRKWSKTILSDKADLTMSGAAVVVPIPANEEPSK